MEGYNYSWQLASIGLVVCIIMLIISKPFVTYNNPQKNNVNKGVKFFFLLYILNSIFSFWEWDTYHSWWEFLYLDNTINKEIIAYEPVYNVLAKLTNYHYFLWRTCIWLPACLLFFLSGKRLNILNRNFLLSITLFCAFSYCTRNLLGIALLILGLIMFIDNNSRSKIIGVCVVAASYYFHKTMFITILFAVSAFFSLNKKRIWLLVLLFPFLSMATTYLIDNIVSGAWVITLGDMGEEGNKVVAYSGRERSIATIFGIMQNIITFLPQYLALIYATKRIVFDNILEKDDQKRIWTHLFKFSFIAIYIASTFYYTETSSWIYERFKYMGIIPLVFVIAKVWSLEKKTNIWVKSLILLQLFSLSYRWFIQYYHWSQL